MYNEEADYAYAAHGYDESQPSTSGLQPQQRDDNEPPQAKRARLDDTGLAPTDDSEQETLPASVVGKFTDALSKFSKRKEKIGKPVEDTSLVELANSVFGEGISYDRYKTLSEEIERPENAKLLTPVEVNSLIWALLAEPTRNLDKRMQIIQTALAKSGICLTRMMDILSKNEDGGVDREIVQEMKDLGIDALGLIGHGYHLLSLRRRDLMKPDVDWQYANLCTADAPHTKYLFGDDIHGVIKDISTHNQVSNKLRPAKTGYNVMRGNRHGYGYGFPVRKQYPYIPQRGRGRQQMRGVPRGSGAFRRSGYRSRGRGGRAAHPYSTQPRGEVSKFVVFDKLNDIGPLSFEAGRLKQFVTRWQQITSDREILQTVSGCTIEFESGDLPVQTRPRKSVFNKSQSIAVDHEIEKLIKKHVIESCEPENGEFISNIFLVPKKNGEFRMILNLKEFNQSVQYYHFKMETFDMAVKLISQGCFMASIDIKDAYYCVPVHEDFRKYL
jgi:hypothetical protein